jgi:membrane-associated protease RseP (regulator of RpoE activity)
VRNDGTPPGFLMHEGDRLSPPHDKAKIESIGADGVTFVFDEPGREKETLVPAEFDVKAPIVQVSPNGVILPALNSKIARGKPAAFNPAHTIAIGKDRYVLGREDMEYLNQNYPEVLGTQIRWERHQDPRTGRYDGIEIKDVAPGSLAAQHGAQEGDVIKSINGHAVTSVQEAITFAKNNAGKYTTWEIVVESHGQTKTITYQSPQQ